jgi:hypothetical protein
MRRRRGPRTCTVYAHWLPWSREGVYLEPRNGFDERLRFNYHVDVQSGQDQRDRLRVPR